VGKLFLFGGMIGYASFNVSFFVVLAINASINRQSLNKMDRQPVTEEVACHNDLGRDLRINIMVFLALYGLLLRYSLFN
jgi:hypothetical protein